MDEKLGYGGEERREHTCLHEGDIAVLMEFKNDTKKLIWLVASSLIVGLVNILLNFIKR
jgi:hypothetical protein